MLEALPAFPPRAVRELRRGRRGRRHAAHADRPTRPARRGSGAVTRFEVSASRLGDGLLVVYDDIGARARAQATERRYGAVLEATSDWVSIADGDNNLVYINPAGRRMVGIGLDEDITGRRDRRVLARVGARACAPRGARRRARRDGVWRGDLARLHRDGHEIPISQVIVAPSTADGEVDFYATIARDMTRERAAEAALRESEERFRVAFEQAPIGVSLIDLEGTSCRSTTPTARRCGARARSSCSSARRPSRTPTTSR